MKKQLIILIALIQNFVFCQKNEWYNYKEKIELQTNTKTLITGEKLLYSLYCLDKDNKPSQLSKVAYVKCIDSSGKEVFFNKHYLNKGTSSGYYFIPTELKTGNYKIISYTKWMLNTSQFNYSEKDLLIINPYSKNNFQNNIFNNQLINQDSILDIPLIKKTYKKRQLGATKSFDSELKGNFTISVRKTNEINLDTNQEHKNSNNTTFGNEQKFILPETKGELISGRLISSDNNLPLEKIGIALTDKGNTDYLNITSTNEKGVFYFILSHPLSSENVFIEPINNSNKYSILLDSKIEPKYFVDSLQQKIKLKEGYSKEIENRAIAAQIENAYYEIKKDSTLSPKLISTINKNYLDIFPTDKYSRFSSIKEFITEVLNQVYYTEKNDEFKIHFRNTGVNLELDENPLTIVDGTLILNPNDILKVDFKKIKTISVNYQPYYLGNKLYSGLFIVNTIDSYFDDVSTNKNKLKLDYTIPFSIQIPYFPSYEDNSSLNKIPDYRVQLLWKNTTNLKEPIPFYTSDIEGTYEISIQGFSNEGKYINEKDYFNVE